MSLGQGAPLIDGSRELDLKLRNPRTICFVLVTQWCRIKVDTEARPPPWRGGPGGGFGGSSNVVSEAWS
jgi:hypothetical protein